MLSPFPQNLTFPPETVLNLKTHHNMFWFPAINHSINSTSVNRSAWNLLPGSGGWIQGQGQKSKALSDAAAKLPWAVGRKRKFSLCSRGPTSSLGPGGTSTGPVWGSCLQGLLSSPQWTGCLSLRHWNGSWFPLGGQGQLFCHREICGALPAAGAQGRQLWAPCWAVALGLSFTEVLSLVDSWSLRGWQWWWSPFSRAENITLRACHQGRGWHLGSLVMLQMGCVSCYPAAPSTFPQIRPLNRSELSLSALFSILSPLKNFPSILGIRECHSFDASFVLLHQKQNILMEKSQLKGDIHLYESTQLERKTWSSV